MVPVAVVVAVVAGAALVRGYGRTSDFDRAAAVERTMARSAGRLDRAQAECYVDRVLADVGRRALETDPPPPELVARLTGIRIDCVGVANLGTVPGTSPPVTVPGVVRPQKPGDDPVLDALYQRCGAGSGAACDELFDKAASGSAYEAFALTCGGRTSEARCADRYPG
jgi:hypothetical protein